MPILASNFLKIQGFFLIGSHYQKIHEIKILIISKLSTWKPH